MKRNNRRARTISKQTARTHLSYADASDQLPCEGRHASPSNPTGTAGGAQAELTETLVLRCSTMQKDAIRSKAKRAGVPVSRLLREALGLVEVRRRRQVPFVSPLLLREVARAGNNLNQIARAANTTLKRNPQAIIITADAITRLIMIERLLRVVLDQHRHLSGGNGVDEC